MPFGAYCYTTMSFGLKNIGATYQRAIQMCLDQQIGRNIEAYIDDLVVKSKTADSLIADLEEMFANLKRYRWKLNPSKCIFGVPSGILLHRQCPRYRTQPQQGLRHHQHETAYLHKGYIEARRVHGYS